MIKGNACNYSAIGTAGLSVAPNSARIASNGVCLCFFAVSIIECRSKTQVSQVNEHTLKLH